MMLMLTDLLMDESSEEDGDFASTSDLHHDQWLEPTPGKTLAGIADELFAQTEARRPDMGRKPRADAVQRRKVSISNLVANLALLVLHHTLGKRLAISAKNEARTRYDRAGFRSNLVSEAAAALEGLGIVTRTLGTRNIARSTITPTPALRRRLSNLELSDITKAEGAETIILLAREGEQRQSQGQTNKILIDYEDTDETNRLRAEMATINANLSSARITWAREPLPPFLLIRRFLIASPNAPHTFDLHGRIYGGPWIGMARESRHLLRLGGESLADLDFTGMFVQLAYLKAGLPLPGDDPYLGVLGLTDAAAGDDPEERASKRDAVKRTLSALLCRSGPMTRLPSAVKERLGGDWTAARLTAALSERHPGIAHLFGSDIGVRLMFTESRILVRTLLDLIEQEVPALPVHDGIMVPASKQELAEQTMRRVSAEILGTTLPVRAKRLGRK